MKANRIREIIAGGEAAINGWLHIPSSWSAEIMARAGWDSVTVDMQHGFHDVTGVLTMIQAIECAGAVPLARVNWNEPGIIMKLLDAGALGIICPMIESGEQCEAFVGACRFPPRGYRSLGPTRAKPVYGADYAERANEEILSVAMVETVRGLEAVDEIVAVEGLSGIFIGGGDLRLSLSAAKSSASLDEAMARILEAARSQGLWAGLFTTDPEEGRRRIEEGFQFVTVKTDGQLLAEHARRVVDTLKG